MIKDGLGDQSRDKGGDESTSEPGDLLTKPQTKSFKGTGGSLSMGVSAAMPNPVKKRSTKSRKRF